jgi:hypothetical protein
MIILFGLYYFDIWIGQVKHWLYGLFLKFDFSSNNI